MQRLMNKLGTPLAVASLVLVFLVMPIVVAAQAPVDPTKPAWLIWLGGFLQNPLVLLGTSTLFARAPGVRTFIANELIPYLNTGIAAVGTIILFFQHTGASQTLLMIGPGAALAGPLSLHAPVAIFGLGAGGFVGGLANAIWSAVQTHILYSTFLHKQLGPDPEDSKKLH